MRSKHAGGGRPAGAMERDSVVARGWVYPGIKLERFRDLTLIYPGEEGPVMVVACDSAGGVGPKKGDTVRVPARVVGKFTARVALMEVMAAGTVLVCLVNNLCVEPEPTGREILAGIREEAGLVGLDDISITGSMERNIPTVQTGVGITVLGLARPGMLRLGRSLSGHRLVCVGVPLVGEEVVKADDRIMDLPALKALLGLPYVREVLPVGSGGIGREAANLARGAGCELALHAGISLDLARSAGPATCVLVTLEGGDEEEIERLTGKPAELIGYLR